MTSRPTGARLNHLLLRIRGGPGGRSHGECQPIAAPQYRNRRCRKLDRPDYDAALFPFETLAVESRAQRRRCTPSDARRQFEIGFLSLCNASPGQCFPIQICHFISGTGGSRSATLLFQNASISSSGLFFVSGRKRQANSACSRHMVIRKPKVTKFTKAVESKRK